MPRVFPRCRIHGLSLRINQTLSFLAAAIFMSSFSIVYFIYTSPGRANAYLYRFSNLQRSYGDLILRQITNGSQLPPDLAVDEIYEPLVYLPLDFRILQNETCPEKFPEMQGSLPINLTEVSIAEVNANFSNIINFGGHWEPIDCKPKYHVAILVPFRDRFEHLPIFFRHLIPMMKKQHLSFTVFVVEQRGQYPFNRAMLLNVGFLEALKFYNFDCFVFHDVDHIPENDRNYYGCDGMPRHFTEQLDIHDYKLEYDNFFGGVSGVTTDQFYSVNGFANQFWGWGGEDDDFYTRIKQRGYNVSRPPYHYGRYSSIKKHHTQEAMFLGRFSLLKQSVERNFLDGLNSLLYPEPIITQEALYTNISVKLSPVKDLSPPPEENSSS